MVTSKEAKTSHYVLCVYLFTGYTLFTYLKLMVLIPLLRITSEGGFSLTKSHKMETANELVAKCNLTLDMSALDFCSIILAVFTISSHILDRRLAADSVRPL